MKRRTLDPTDPRAVARFLKPFSPAVRRMFEDLILFEAELKVVQAEKRSEAEGRRLAEQAQRILPHITGERRKEAKRQAREKR